MKVLIAYHTRTGNTRKAAELISAELPAELEQLKEESDRAGLVGYLKAAKDAMLKRETSLLPLKHDPSQFDLVIIGTPIWAFTMTPVIRTYLQQCAPQLPRVAFFCTMTSNGDRRAFNEMAAICHKAPDATLALKASQLKNERYRELIKQFAARLFTN